MDCPIGQHTVSRLVCYISKEGVATWGCSKCISTAIPKQDSHVYTGRKLWAGHEVWPDKNRREQATADSEQKMIQRAAEYRNRYTRPSQRALSR